MKTVVTAFRLAVAVGAFAASPIAATSHAAARGLEGRDNGGGRQSQDLVQDEDSGDRADRLGARSADNARPFIPLEYIISQIQARTPGRLVGVRGPNGQGIYRIVWETPDGRVLTFVVDGRTGQVLR